VHGYPSHLRAPPPLDTLPSGRRTPRHPTCLGLLLDLTVPGCRLLFPCHPRLPRQRTRRFSMDPLSVVPSTSRISTGAHHVRRASNASTTGSATKTSFTSVGENTHALNLVATGAFGGATHSTNITSNATVARLVLMLKRLSSSFESANTGLAGSALPCTQQEKDTSSTLHVILSPA
jgi:hypothetical protein